MNYAVVGILFAVLSASPTHAGDPLIDLHVTIGGYQGDSDGPRHRGAALLEYDSTKGELRGEYWSNRAGTKGLNTAGLLILRRI